MTEKSGDASEKEASPFSFPEVRGQKFYPLTSAAQDGISTDASVSAIPAVQKSEADSLNSEASVTNTDVRLRSQPIQINPITYDSGNPGYLVVGTVVPKQKPWREKFRDRAEAELRQREWEDERIRMAAGMQMRATELSNNALRDAEAALKAARILGFPSLLEAVMAVGKPSPAPAVSVSPQRSYKQLFDEFVAFHKDHASKSQSDKVRQTAKLFGDDIGWDTSITGIETSDVQKWVKAHTKNLSKKTFNNVLNDVSRVFSWAAEPAQKYLTENPAAAIPRYNSRVLAAGAREIIKVETCQKLMAYLEEHHPEWVFSFALMLFAGVRPGYHDGEIAKLMRCANRDGIETYISGGMLLLTAKITKDRRPRQLPMPPNLVAWITRYMPKKGEFRLGDRDVYAEIRARFKIPHDGLRHTAISAHVTKHGSFAMAALEFGNSEKVIRTHYYSRMLREDADAFYEIWPRAA